VSNSERIVDVVSEEAARLGCTLSESETLGLTHFVKLLAHWNQHIRLTGSSNPRQMVREQLADALVLARCLPGNEAQQCVDVGSGGGLPALPLLILRPELRLTLVEARGRKCSFLQTASFQLQLACTVRHQRVEQLHHGDLFDVAWSRATFPPEKWLQVAARLLKPGGLAVIFAVDEVPHTLPEGIAFKQREDYALHNGAPRALLFYSLSSGNHNQYTEPR